MFIEPKSYKKDPETQRRITKELYGEEYEPEDVEGLDPLYLLALQFANLKGRKNYLLDDDDGRI